MRKVLVYSCISPRAKGMDLTSTAEGHIPGAMSGDKGRIGGSNLTLTMREAAEYVGYSYSRFQKHYKVTWRIPYSDINGRMFFRVRDLDAHLERHRHEPHDDPRGNE